MKNALIIVDAQNDFCEGGSLAVKNSNEIFPVINKIRDEYEEKFQTVCLTQDNHPEDHISFKDSPLLNDETIIEDELTKKWQGVFPRHCVQNTHGQKTHPDLKLKGNEIYFKKGENKLKEEFSGFANPYLNAHLNDLGIKNVFVVGLAYDFCAGSTAIDSSVNNYTTYLVKDASKPISTKTTEKMEIDFKKYKVKVITSDDFKNIL